MDQAEIDNWKAIANSMDANGNIKSWFYLRARAIAEGKPDPMPNISKLMPESAWSESCGSIPNGCWCQQGGYLNLTGGDSEGWLINPALENIPKHSHFDTIWDGDWLSMMEISLNPYN